MPDRPPRVRFVLFWLLGMLVMAPGCDVRERRSDKSERAERSARAELEAAEEKVKKLERELDEQGAKVKNLEGFIAQEKDETKKAKLQATLDAAKQAEADLAAQLGRKIPARSSAEKPSIPRPACTCKATDPLCDCL